MWARGIRKQDRVSILAQNTLEFMEFYSACELSGFIAATVNWRLAAPEIEWILSDSTPRVLIFEAQYAGMVAKIRDRLGFVDLFLCFGGDVPEWAEDYYAFRDQGDLAGAPSRPAPDEHNALDLHVRYYRRPKGAMRKTPFGNRESAS